MVRSRRGAAGRPDEVLLLSRLRLSPRGAGGPARSRGTAGMRSFASCVLMLSGGQKQRVAIARAMAVQPRGAVGSRAAAGYSWPGSRYINRTLRGPIDPRGISGQGARRWQDRYEILISATGGAGNRPERVRRRHPSGGTPAALCPSGGPRGTCPAQGRCTACSARPFSPRHGRSLIDPGMISQKRRRKSEFSRLSRVIHRQKVTRKPKAASYDGRRVGRRTDGLRQTRVLQF